MDVEYLECAADMPAELDDIGYMLTLKTFDNMVDSAKPRKSKIVLDEIEYDLDYYKDVTCYVAPADRAHQIWEICRRISGELDDYNPDDRRSTFDYIYPNSMDVSRGASGVIEKLIIEIDGTGVYYEAMDGIRRPTILPIIEGGDRPSRWWRNFVGSGPEPEVVVLLYQCSVDPVALGAIANLVSLTLIAVETTTESNVQAKIAGLKSITFGIDGFTNGEEDAHWLEIAPSMTVSEVNCNELNSDTFGGIINNLSSMFPNATITHS